MCHSHRHIDVYCATRSMVVVDLCAREHHYRSTEASTLLDCQRNSASAYVERECHPIQARCWSSHGHPCLHGGHRLVGLVNFGEPDETSANPCPVRLLLSYALEVRLRTSLGTISSIYSGARLIDIISAIRVRARSPKYLKWPRMLTRAIWLLTWLVVLSAAVTGVDLWLHFDASPTSDVPTSTNFAAMGYDPNIMLFSRSINDSWCATENQRTTAIGAGSCGLSE